ncbi:MAG: hypothetical protein JJU05_00760 [Verrucomicrobia bacterium]|nr:hypothetical protein [Verrucomicrobiota bacterium]MCH8526358.1 hypothetical protein [Kiritimatiellia bacterium]
MDTDTFPPCLGGGEVRMGVDLMYGMYEMNSQIFAACWISENQWNQWFNSGGEEPLMNTDTCPLCLGGGDLGYGEKKPLITLMPFRRAWVKAI